MRAFLVNGQLQNLKYLVERGMWSTVHHRNVYLGPLYGVSVGCHGKCASSPCLNNGTCIEGYSDYTCNCRWTAFKGPICADGERCSRVVGGGSEGGAGGSASYVGWGWIGGGV